MLFKKKYVYKILVKRGEGWEVVKTLKTDKPADTISFSDKTYIVDYSKSIVDNNAYILFYELNNASPLQFKNAEKIDAKLLNIVIKSNILSKIFKPSSIFDYMIYIILGIAVGFILGQAVAEAWRNPPTS
jgi:hypothetical protein